MLEEDGSAAHELSPIRFAPALAFSLTFRRASDSSP